MADLADLGAVLGGDGLYALREDGPRIVAAEALGVGTVHHGEPECLVEPDLGPTHVVGVDGESGSKGEAPLLGQLPKAIEGRPGTLRVDMVDGHRGDAAPVVDAGIEQRPEVVGEVRRSLYVHLVREDQTCQCDGLEVVV